MKKGKFYTFEIPSRNDSISGFILDYNKEWILIRRCFDYRLDGFSLFKRDKDLVLEYGTYERISASIFKLKKYNYKKEKLVKITDLNAMLKEITKRYFFLQIESNDGEALDVVNFIGKDNEFFLFKELTVNAKWRFRLSLEEQTISFISFGSEYLNSLKLLMQKK